MVAYLRTKTEINCEQNRYQRKLTKRKVREARGKPRKSSESDGKG